MSTIHIVNDEADIAIWLDTEDGREDGVCVGCGETTQEALLSAEADLVQALEAVRAQIVPPVTAESVAQAKDAARAERVAHGLDPDTGRPTPRNPGDGVAS